MANTTTAAIPTQFTFTELQLSQLIAFLTARGIYNATTNKVSVPLDKTSTTGLFSQAYTLINSFIAQNSSSVDQNTKTWFKEAVGINQDSTSSLANGYIRGVTEYGLLLNNKLAGLSQSAIKVDLQQTSNLIGQNVINNILAAGPTAANGKPTGGIPIFANMVSGDIAAAIVNPRLPQTLGGWGGSFYYWNTPISGCPSVGSLIQSGGTVEINNTPVTLAPSLTEFYYDNASAESDCRDVRPLSV